MPASRPRLLPATGRQRLCLGLLLAFTLLKGLVWGVTIPYFWGADEDYHFNYVETLSVEHRLPDPDKLFYPREFFLAEVATHQEEYAQGPREDFDGDPRASVRALEDLPKAEREGTLAGRGVGVVHPPLYHLTGAAANSALGDASTLTRFQAIRFVSALYGVLAVYFAWLLAAQLLARFRHQALAALIVSVQPIFSYTSAIVNHEIALVAFFTAALAMMMFILRSPPRAAQGAWLGAATVAALFVKGSAVALVPLGLLAFLAQWLVFSAPEQRRAVLRSAGVWLGMIVVLAGWWYIRARIVYGSSLGATTDYTGSEVGGSVGPGVATDSGPFAAIRYAREWIGIVYKTYWFHYLQFEDPTPSSFWYWVPMVWGWVGIAGAGALAWTKRRRLLDPEDPLLRQVLLCVLAALALLLSFMGLDVMRRLNGDNFFATAGRYLMSAFPAVAAVFVAGLCALFRGRAQAVVLWAAGISAVALNVRVYEHHWLTRYYGDVSVGELLRRVSFDRPEFVTRGTLAGAAVLAVALLVAFAATATWPRRGEPQAR